MEAAELMLGQKKFSSPFIRTILAVTPDDQIVAPRHAKDGDDISREQIARLERELAAAQSRTKYVEDTYDEDNLQLTIARAYLAKLLSKPSILRWLEIHQPEYLAGFQEIVDLASLAPKNEEAAR
jgi:hypothetical protein